ncbi:DUF6489 family protein [Thiothrix lacustris]|uniref:DUF6489 family protein n=1 Tax=Thiothrix lacustris TaxID=525917 RepID=UPI0027E3EC1B|nr:DUF6489 family protein [Thiothrix lacustris]WMP15818.1 DUF6489 family protein [Thiothrix lacustris]
MNITVNVEMTPEDLRRIMGLPDVQEFNREVMAQMLKKMQEGVEGYDPMAFFKPGVMGNADMFKQWADMFGKFSSGAKS